ncbi:hypothetical protein Pogu_1640 [Pyrobaculum oguniense TE7]|uniref:Uncharacterized protein n=1 Tax=Pyrobaculum oguniense (strain DSM 13380 / JCM 10595 / TE7) TaxID=698757 RepID=H6QAP1_PYROT|nr:hypothetical protein Pogu_1640 [Pyrobaculum oguniense TE7]
MGLESLLANNYITFGVTLSAYLMVPIALGLRRGVPVWARGVSVAAAVTIAAIVASLVLGLRPLELYFFAIFLLFAATYIAALPYRSREPYLFTALIMTSTLTLVTLNLLFQRMFFLGCS